MPIEQGIHATGGGGGGPASTILTSGATGRVNALISFSSFRSLIRFIELVINVVVFIILSPFRGRRRYSAAKEERPECGAWKATAMVQRKTEVSAAAAADEEVARRRAMAIRRVVEDEDRRRSARAFELFVSPRGATLFTQSWTPVSGKIRGLVILMHGLNEHSGRYGEFAKQLNDAGFKVYGMDWIGHGGSDGLHGYVHSLDDAVTDLKVFLDHVLAQNSRIPCFCFGHSTGAAIILKAVLDPLIEGRINGVVLTSPAVSVQPSHPLYTVLAPLVSFLVPRYQCGAANKKGAIVSRDPEALVAKYSDPLVYTGAIRVKTGYEILRITAYLRQNLGRVGIPFLVLHGTADAVTDPAASNRLYLEAASMDKTIKLYEGLLHDLLFEPERNAIIHDIVEWWRERTSVTKPNCMYQTCAMQEEATY